MVLVSILDVEQILANAFGEAMIVDIPPAQVDEDTNVFFVDDSVVARRKIAESPGQARGAAQTATSSKSFRIS